MTHFRAALYCGDDNVKNGSSIPKNGKSIDISTEILIFGYWDFSATNVSIDNSKGDATEW